MKEEMKNKISKLYIREEVNFLCNIKGPHRIIICLLITLVR